MTAPANAQKPGLMCTAGASPSASPQRLQKIPFRLQPLPHHHRRHHRHRCLFRFHVPALIVHLSILPRLFREAAAYTGAAPSPPPMVSNTKMTFRGSACQKTGWTTEAGGVLQRNAGRKRGEMEDGGSPASGRRGKEGNPTRVRPRGGDRKTRGCQAAPAQWGE